jgi:hypothetical protein
MLLNVSSRGTTEIAGPPLPTFIFENCWPVMLAGRIGLETAIHQNQKKPSSFSIGKTQFQEKQLCNNGTKVPLASSTF